MPPPWLYFDITMERNFCTLNPSLESTTQLQISLNTHPNFMTHNHYQRSGSISAKQLKVIIVDTFQVVQCTALDKGNLILVLQASNVSKKHHLWIFHCASNYWVMKASKLTELVAIITQCGVSVLQGIESTGLNKEVTNWLDIVVAANNLHEIRKNCVKWKLCKMH